MELNALSQLIGMPVETQGGRRLGRVYEVRARSERGAPVCAELLLGRAGLGRRLRGPREPDHGLPWEAVVELTPTRIVVR